MSYKVTKGKPSVTREGETSSFQTFEDLEVYKAAREFRKRMYGVTRRLPDFERYELGSQIRRAAVSLTNNMAEGHGRFHYPDQIRFFLHSRGSLEELVDDLNVCLDENYLSAEEVAKLKEQARGVLILINGYLRYLRSRSSSIRESEGAYSQLSGGVDDLPL
jgi:four helix bundle protein